LKQADRIICWHRFY